MILFPGLLNNGNYAIVPPSNKFGSLGRNKPKSTISQQDISALQNDLKQISQKVQEKDQQIVEKRQILDKLQKEWSEIQDDTIFEGNYASNLHLQQEITKLDIILRNKQKTVAELNAKLCHKTSLADCQNGESSKIICNEAEKLPIFDNGLCKVNVKIEDCEQKSDFVEETTPGVWV